MLTDIIEILRLAKDAVTSLVTQRNAAAGRAWDQVAVDLDKLSELATLHTKAIDAVTAPLINEGDLVKTSRLYNLLANNPDFPQGYGLILGALDATKDLKPFHKPELQERVKAVLDELYKFQYGAFRLDWDSYQIADAFAQSARLFADNGSSDQISQAAAPFIHSHAGVFGQPADSLPNAPATPTELALLLQSWSKSWQRYVQNTLYGGRGLNYAIGQLKMQQYVN
jgi:hypothetical protein